MAGTSSHFDIHESQAAGLFDKQFAQVFGFESRRTITRDDEKGLRSVVVTRMIDESGRHRINSAVVR
jgi:ssDNA-binding replication factor A large subunit